MIIVRLFTRAEAFSILSLVAILLLVGPPVGCTISSSGAENLAKLRQNLAKVGPCVIKSIYSNVYPEARLPTTVDQLKGSCRAQTEGFKCVKDGIKPLPAILKRGLHTWVQGRQRHHKKYCTNVSSEVSRQFLLASKCVVENKLPVYEALESKFAHSLVAIHERNFNDSALELKYFCCTVINFRTTFGDNAGPECESHKQLMEEMIVSVVPGEINLICDNDDDKLTSKVCPNLEPLKVPTSKFVSKPGNDPTLMALYLVSTLGEPEV